MDSIDGENVCTDLDVNIVWVGKNGAKRSVVQNVGGFRELRKMITGGNIGRACIRRSSWNMVRVIGTAFSG